ncbi:Uncharacterised protein [Vibrio cholerae]|nr:Uncharacterised protein [Vibrio cholerae]CSC04201.1 Uncharacterised protein [Vibrio cholerae]CSC09523.1 Uncharacterised protein [Vibrio cholerae]CSH89662.1 Uncharacterised protein [Vibrio cholerae]
MQQLIIAKHRRNPGTFRHKQIAQWLTDTPFVGFEFIDKQLPLAGRINFHARARNRLRFWGQFHFRQRHGFGQRSTLHHQRHHNHEKREVEVKLSVGQTRHHWEDCKDDRHGATQPNPRDKPFLTCGKTFKRRKANPYRNGARKEDHPHRQR